MIVTLSGTAGAVGLDHVVVEVGGVGLLVRTTPGTAAGFRPGMPVQLSTSLVVREESWTLYGFAEAAEKEVFETVQTVSGIGPRLALAMLSVLTPDQVRASISSGDLVTLVKVPGIGKRSAERLVVELRDKIGGVGLSAGSVGTTSSVASPAEPLWRTQVREALVGLGWTARQADEALGAVEPLAAQGAGVAELLRAALRELGR